MARERGVGYKLPAVVGQTPALQQLHYAAAIPRFHAFARLPWLGLVERHRQTERVAQGAIGHDVELEISRGGKLHERAATFKHVGIECRKPHLPKARGEAFLAFCAAAQLVSAQVAANAQGGAGSSRKQSHVSGRPAFWHAGEHVQIALGASRLAHAFQKGSYELVVRALLQVRSSAFSFARCGVELYAAAHQAIRFAHTLKPAEHAVVAKSSALREPRPHLYVAMDR